MKKKGFVKRLLRKGLKRRIVACGASEREEALLWAYNAPLGEWRDRLWCMNRGGSLKYAEELPGFLQE